MSGNTIGKVGIVATDKNNVLINQRVLILKTDIHNVAIPYLLIKDTQIQNKIRQLSANSAQPNISEADLCLIKYWEIPKDLVKKFGEITGPFFSKIINCKIENQQLASLRDFLLPMLMNGQVKFETVL